LDPKFDARAKPHALVILGQTLRVRAIHESELQCRDVVIVLDSEHFELNRSLSL
jgi:hypothetical protein